VRAEPVISIVEDDESLRTALIGLLRAAGYSGRGFASAEEFLAVQDGACACVITDVRLPGESGLDMIGRLRKLGYQRPVIVITAGADPAIADAARAQGALCVLTKPFEADQLLDCVARALAAG